MKWLRDLFDRLSRRLGGARILAMPLLRTLAVGAAVLWLALAPDAYRDAPALVAAVVGFVLYSAGVELALWLRPVATLRLNFWVLLVDQAFALVLIRLTGGFDSALFLGLLLIAALQSYYYGMRRCVAVAMASSLAYVVTAWPVSRDVDLANGVIRCLVLVGTAVVVAVVAEAEERERLQVVTLTAEARKRERFIRNVFEHLREGVFVVDAEGRVAGWNRALEERYGIAATQAIGRPYHAVLPGLGRPPARNALESLLHGGTEAVTLDEVSVGPVDGRRVVVNLTGTLLREGGRPAGAAVLIEDISQRLALERSARQAEKLAALGTLAAGLAHELNNPIGVISSRSELLLLDSEGLALPEETRQDLLVIHRHAQRVARIAQGLLSFARHPSGTFGPVDLNRVVDETLLLVEKTIVKDGVTLKCALEPGLPPVHGDANALQQVVMNLVTNARDAVEDGGEIAIETARADGAEGGVRLTVRDNGPGIPPEVLPRIFDPFFTTKATGTGLGLSISYGIIREHQGTVDVSSQPGEGTTFVLTLRTAATGVPA